MFRDRRGVSEAISFVLVFALMISTVAVVYTAGYAGLVDMRDSERIDNAERAMDILATNIDDMIRRGAPTRGTEIQLADATIGSGEATYINVSLSDSSLNDTSTGNLTIDPIVYSADDTEIRYALGAVVRIEEGGSAMLVDPPFVVGTDHTVVPLIQTNFDDGSVSGSSTVLIRTSRQLRETLVFETQTYDTLRINITTPAGGAWSAFLEDEGMSCTTTDLGGGRSKVTCTLSDVERAAVPWYLIKVTLD